MMQQGKHSLGPLFMEWSVARPQTMLILLLCHPQVRPLCSNTPPGRRVSPDQRPTASPEPHTPQPTSNTSPGSALCACPLRTRASPPRLDETPPPLWASRCPTHASSHALH